ncbi:MAG: hydrogenase expression/formation protein HypE [Arcanobacterium sp.]|nr:hydrogenase expression/formation protein HypE [Arcanobacterium sp.]
MVKSQRSESEVLDGIERARRHGDKLKDEFVTLAHGAGGKASAQLVEQVFVAEYGNEILGELTDAGVLSFADMVAAAQSRCELEVPASTPLAAAHTDSAQADSAQAAHLAPRQTDREHCAAARLAFSTDSYVVNPIKFPGGSIGDLAVNGTVNDLAVTGAVPYGISAAFVIEEGLPIATLREIVADMHAAADRAGVQIVTGDTKVVPKGAADKLYITTAGVGVIPLSVHLAASSVQRGDRILLSGAIADHGMAVMMARGELGINAPIKSDTRAVNGLTAALLRAAPHTRWIRDATRGGLGTVLNELARATNYGVAIYEDQILVHDMARGAADMLGIDPLYVANEGMFAAVVPENEAAAALAAVQAEPGGEEARLAGKIVAKPEAAVVLVTGFGGTRLVDMLVGDPLPRIC